MNILSRWLAPAALAAGLGIAALTPAPARAQDDQLVRVLVDIADVVIRNGAPYYRHGDYRYDDRLRVRRDAYGRPIYFRYIPNERYHRYYRSNPPYGNAYGYYRNAPRQWSNAGHRDVKCNKHGKCKAEYYDYRHDRDRWRDDDDDRYGRWRHDDD